MQVDTSEKTSSGLECYWVNDPYIDKQSMMDQCLFFHYQQRQEQQLLNSLEQHTFLKTNLFIMSAVFSSNNAVTTFRNSCMDVILEQSLRLQYFCLEGTSAYLSKI